MKKLLLPLALAALLLTSCGLFPNPQFASAQSRWRNANVSHYRYSLRVGCFCAFTQRMPLTIEVANGVIRSMSYSDGTPVPAGQAPIFARYSTIDALFDYTAEALRQADEIKIQYDPTYGFPANVQIDFIKQAIDDELGLTVTDFQPLPQQ